MPYKDPEKRRAARAQAQARRMADPDYRKRHNAYQREYQRAHPPDNTRRNHKALYGLTRAEYTRLVALQCGTCTICGGVPSGDPDANLKVRSLVVDHDHLTGRVRGLLCFRCNLMCGHSGDNAERLETAARYLRESEQI